MRRWFLGDDPRLNEIPLLDSYCRIVAPRVTMLPEAADTLKISVYVPTIGQTTWHTVITGRGKEPHLEKMCGRSIQTISAQNRTMTGP